VAIGGGVMKMKKWRIESVSENNQPKISAMKISMACRKPI
jgi:hypothetical protein